jgi:glyceraldehyde 3-phosphate dehydrogenase
MIPTHTGAARAVGEVLPHLRGKLDGMAIRVPTANVSIVDLHAMLDRAVSDEAVLDAFRQAAQGPLKNVLGVNELPLVSGDFNHNPLSSIVDATGIHCMERQIKIMSWYDNEWGFTNRMLDVAGYWLNRVQGASRSTDQP